MTDSKAAPLLGRLAVHLKMISMDQLAEAVRVQGRAGQDKKLGEILVACGFIDRTQLAKLIAAQQQLLAKHTAKPAPATAAPAAAPAPIGPAPAARPAPAPRAPVPTTATAAGPAPVGSASDFAAPTDTDRARFEDILRHAI